MRTVVSACFVAGCLFWTSEMLPAQQGVEIGAGVGIAAPIGGAAEQRSLGPHLFASVGYQFSPRFQIRGDFTLAQLRGDPHPADGNPPSFSNYGDLRLSGFSGNLVYRPGAALPLAPYAFVGVGAYAMRNLAGVPNPYGVVPGVSVGAGANIDARSITFFSEARIEAVLSDFGAPEFRPTAYVPVAVGVRVPITASR